MEGYHQGGTWIWRILWQVCQTLLCPGNVSGQANTNIPSKETDIQLLKTWTALENAMYIVILSLCCNVYTDTLWYNVVIVCDALKDRLLSSSAPMVLLHDEWCSEILRKGIICASKTGNLNSDYLMECNLLRERIYL